MLKTNTDQYIHYSKRLRKLEREEDRIHQIKENIGKIMQELILSGVDFNRVEEEMREKA